jgi:broad specificity phosphatase PhoE
MQLYVVRHGQTLANVQHRYLGALDPELTDIGREQAVALRMELPDAIDSIVVSPLLRARQTADIIRYRNDLPLQVVDAFRERNVGVFEGLTQSEAQARYPELWQQNITRHWNAAPPQGESIQQVVQRVHAGLVRLLTEPSSRHTLLVGHGFVAKAVRALVRQDFSDFFEWHLGNGHWLVLDHVERVLDYSLPAEDPLPVG